VIRKEITLLVWVSTHGLFYIEKLLIENNYQIEKLSVFKRQKICFDFWKGEIIVF